MLGLDEATWSIPKRWVAAGPKDESHEGSEVVLVEPVTQSRPRGARDEFFWDLRSRKWEIGRKEADIAI